MNLYYIWCRTKLKEHSPTKLFGHKIFKVLKREMFSFLCVTVNWLLLWNLLLFIYIISSHFDKITKRDVEFRYSTMPRKFDGKWRTECLSTRFYLPRCMRDTVWSLPWYSLIYFDVFILLSKIVYFINICKKYSVGCYLSGKILFKFLR